MRTADMEVVITAVMSPTGSVHAVRPGQVRTVCGWDFNRKLFRRGYGRAGWISMDMPYEHAKVDPPCGNCIKGLQDNTGPGA